MSDYRRKAKSIACPICDAPIGAYCRMPIRKAVHVARYHKAIGLRTAAELAAREDRIEADHG